MRILISGAGIAGPTLAYWLLEHGHEPVIVEHAPAFRDGGYMIDFWGPGYTVAERMGVLPRLEEIGYKIEEMKFVGRKGEINSSLDVNVIYRSLGDRFFSLPRGDLAQTIFETVSDKIEVMFGDSITSLQDDEDGVEVTFKNSANRRFDIVVGCDGLHSAVRRIRFGPEEQFEKYLGYYVASFITDGYPHRDTKSYSSFSAPGCQISRYALRGGRTAFLFVFTQEKKFPNQFCDESAKIILSARFRDSGWIETPEILARLEAATDLYFDAVSQIRMPCWSKGRVALVGDAAHCPSLLAGEGASFAMAGVLHSGGRVEPRAGELRAGFPELRALFPRLHRAEAKISGSFCRKFRAANTLRHFHTRSGDEIEQDTVRRRLANAKVCNGRFPAACLR